MKILFLSRWFPYPPNNGSKVRIRNLLRILAASHQITLLSFDDEPEKPTHTEGLESICKQVITIPWKEFDPNSIKSFVGFFSPKPRSVIDTFSVEMAQQIRTIVAEQVFDIIIASEIEMASYYKYFSDHAVIFEEIEIGVPLERFSRSTSMSSRYRHGISWLKHKYYLKRLLKQYPLCTVTSAEERNLLIETGIRKDNITIIPNFIDLEDYQAYAGEEKNNTLIYTGSFRFQPNYEAMVWFLEEIFPAILESVPDIQLIITGEHLNLPLPHVTNVITTGFVDDIRPLIAQAAVSIVPLLSGGGTRLKILEAMALRTPVVSTSKGAQGIKVTHGKDILLADNPEDFRREVIRVIEHKKLGEELINQGSKLLQTLYSSETISAKYELLLQKATHITTKSTKYPVNTTHEEIT